MNDFLTGSNSNLSTVVDRTLDRFRGLTREGNDLVLTLQPEAQRVAMTARPLEFFDKYDLLLCPATIVPPFPIENRYVAECAGKKFDNYVEWLGIVYAITLVCCPALSMPCGFTASGLPIGLQVVAAPRAEAQLLAGARLLEDILGVRDTTPIDPRAPK